MVNDIASSAILGATTSVIGGGKFGNGAVTAIFAFTFNHIAHGDPAAAKRALKTVAKTLVPGVSLVECALTGACTPIQWGEAALDASQD